MTTPAPAPRSDEPEDRREQKRRTARQELQRQAMRLFAEQGYQATTVEQIAAAAGVSHMTFFRHFSTKDHVVLSDDYDPLLVDVLADRPHDEPALDMVRHAILHGLQRIYPARREELLARWRLLLATPELRARQAERTETTHQLLVAGLATHPGHGPQALHTHTIAAAGLAAATTASLLWAKGDGAEELPDLITTAFDALTAVIPTQAEQAAQPPVEDRRAGRGSTWRW